MKHVLIILAVSATLASGQEYLWINFAGSLTQNGDADGGPGVSRFSQLYGVDVDGSDNVWVADRSTSKVKRITPAGVVSTVLGNFSGLTQLAVNRQNGNVYVVDLGAQSILKMAPPYTSAVSIDSGYTAIGIGVDSSTDTVYVGNFDNQTIRRITSNGTVSTVAGAGTAGRDDGPLASATFRNPCGIAVDSAHNLYVADRENNAVRYVNFGSGMVSTVAGNGSTGCVDGTGEEARFFALTGVAMGPDGNVYIADQDNFSVRKMTPAGVVTTIGGTCGMSGATDGIGTNSLNGFIGQVAVDSDGNVYTADRGQLNGRARVNKGMPLGVSTLEIRSITILPPEAEWNWVNFAGAPGEPGDTDGPTGTSRLNGTYGVDLDGAGNVWIADRNNGKIKRATPAGVVTTILGDFSGLTQIAVNRQNGNVYVVDLGTTEIKKLVPPYTSAVTIDSGYTAVGLGVDSSTDTVYVGDFTRQAIRRIASGATSGTQVAGSGSAGLMDGTLTSCMFNNPCGIAVDSAHNLYVADRENHAVRYVNFGNNQVTTVAGNGSPGCADGLGSNASFTALTGVAVGSDGNIYIADQDNFIIRKMTPGGMVSTIGGACGQVGGMDGIGMAARFGNVAQVAMDASLNLYVADRNSRVSKGNYSADNRKVQIIFEAGMDDTPETLAVVSSGVVDSGYTDANAVITSLGDALFRAVVDLNGDRQFYQIRR